MKTAFILGVLNIAQKSNVLMSGSSYREGAENQGLQSQALQCLNVCFLFFCFCFLFCLVFVLFFVFLLYRSLCKDIKTHKVSKSFMKILGQIEKKKLNRTYDIKSILLQIEVCFH